MARVMFVCMGAAAVEAAVIPAAIAALPVAPVVGSAAIGTMALLGIRRQRQEQKAFFSMEWNQNVEDEDAEECVILGEETVYVRTSRRPASLPHRGHCRINT